MMNEHRKIGRELNLFEMSENANGMVYWKPKGYYVYNKIESYLREVLNKYDHQEVKSPLLANEIGRASCRERVYAPV